MARRFILAQRPVRILGIIHTLQLTTPDFSLSGRVRPLGRMVEKKEVGAYLRCQSVCHLSNSQSLDFLRELSPLVVLQVTLCPEGSVCLLLGGEESWLITAYSIPSLCCFFLQPSAFAGQIT